MHATVPSTPCTGPVISCTNRLMLVVSPAQLPAFAGSQAIFIVGPVAVHVRRSPPAAGNTDSTRLIHVTCWVHVSEVMNAIPASVSHRSFGANMVVVGVVEAVLVAEVVRVLEGDVVRVVVVSVVVGVLTMQFWNKPCAWNTLTILLSVRLAPQQPTSSP